MKGLFISSHRRGSLIDLWLRGEDAKKYYLTITDFKPYFYVESEYGEYKGIFGEDVTKICTSDPSDVPEERQKYKQSWEADIPYARRFMIDHQIYKGVEFPDNKREVSKDEVVPCEVDIEPLSLFFDIEVISSEGTFATPEDADYPVVAITFKFSNSPLYITYIFKENEKERIIRKDNNWVVSYLSSEKNLLGAFYDIVEKHKPDILSNWNIMKYDLLYLKNRFKKLNLQWIDERPFEVFDEYVAYKRIYHRRRYGLKEVAKVEGIVKSNNPQTFKEVRDFYYTDLGRYDVEYVVGIEKKLDIMKHYYEFKYLAGVEDVLDTFKTSVTIDTLLLRIAKDIGVALPTKSEREGDYPFEGAYVFAAEKGYYNDIAWMDFASYYPSIINSFYLSPENISAEGELQFSDFSVHKSEGIVQKLLNILLTQKAIITQKMKEAEPGSEERKSLYRKREAVKGQINSVYGVMGYTGFRLFEPKIAKETTGIGREGLKFIIEIAQKYGYKVLLADTDSIMAQIPFDKAESFCCILNRELRKYFKEKYGVDVNINLEFDKYLKGLFLTGVKKRYAYRCIWEDGKECDYIDSKGFENIRSDQSEFTQNLLEELFDLILYEKEREEIIRYITDKITEFPKRHLNEIAISKGINKSLNSYKANTPHIRGAIYSNQYFGTNFKLGDRVLMLWIKGIDGYQPTNVICFDENMTLPEGLVVDWKRMQKACIEDKVKPILDAIGISLGSSNRRQMTI